MTKYGLVDSEGAPKAALARVSRWNDKTVRHTLYTICGTNQDGWGIFNRPDDSDERAAWLTLYNQIRQYANPAATVITELPADGSQIPNEIASPDTIVGRNANPAKFNWVPISYPASTPPTATRFDNTWFKSKISFADSIKIGANELTAHIRATPGTYAIVGYSQGAAVMSNVLKTMLAGGDLYYRLQDCIGAVAIGNPLRRQGVTFPGGTAPSGAGMFSTISTSANSMLSGLEKTVVPSWWYELVTPDDLYSDVPTEHLDLISAVARSLGVYKAVSDPLDITGNLLNALTQNQAAIEVIAETLWSLVQKIFNPYQPTDLEEATAWMESHIGDNATFVPDPHVLYNVTSPPTLPTGLTGVNSNSTYTDIALAYINARGAAVTPK